MNNQENKSLKDYSDQALFREIFSELERRIKIDPAPFISWSKKFLPILRLVSGEKNCICQGHQTKLQDYTGEELTNEITLRIKNYSLNLISLLTPICVIGGQDINEIRTKLNGRQLTEILAENEDYETTVDGLKRQKGELDAEITLLTNSRKQQIQAKETIITRLKEEKKDLETKLLEAQTKYKKKTKQLDEEQLENNKLVEKIERLEEKIKELTRSKSPLPGEFPKDDQVELEQKHQDQLRAINVLFDENAKDYETIDFNGLYALLAEEAKKKKKKKAVVEPSPIFSRKRKQKKP